MQAHIAGCRLTIVRYAPGRFWDWCVLISKVVYSTDHDAAMPLSLGMHPVMVVRAFRGPALTCPTLYAKAGAGMLLTTFNEPPKPGMLLRRR